MKNKKQLLQIAKAFRSEADYIEKLIKENSKRLYNEDLLDSWQRAYDAIDRKNLLSNILSEL